MGNQALIGFVLIPVNVACMVLGNQDLPLLLFDAPTFVILLPPVFDARDRLGAAVRVRPSVGRVV